MNSQRVDTRSSRRSGNWRMNWILGGILLGLLNTFAVATYASLGVSRNYVVVPNVLLRVFGSGLYESNAYLSQFPAGADWLLMLALGMVIGGFLAALLRGGLNRRSVPRLWRSRFGSSRPRRFAAAFAGGFLLLLGARIAGGCTSGLVLSGSAMLAVAGIVFSITILVSGIITARLIYRRKPS
ncbi:MAG: YeeE/YedE family protein [Thermoleophilia bacterium]|nr:YeeE/YedE family protein [Thermoleophilia bacterium]